MSGPGAAWYPDPHDHSGLRWWDGAAWTAHTHVRVEPGAATAIDTIEPATRPRPDRCAPIVPIEPVMPATSGAVISPVTPVTPVMTGDPITPATSSEPATPGEPIPPTTSIAPLAAPTVADQRPGPAVAPTIVLDTSVRLPPVADVVVRSRRSGWKLRRAGTVLLALLLAGIGAYAAGLLDRFTVATPGREASSAAVKVVEDRGYSFEVPNFWRSEPIDATGFDHAFSVLDQSVIGIGSSRVPRAVDLTDPNVRAFLFDTAARAFQLELGNVTPTSTDPFTVAGAEGQHIVFSRNNTYGEPFQASQTVFLHGRRIVNVTIVTDGFLADSTKTNAEFENLLASFRFS